MSQAYDVLFKLLLIGDSGVGKSSLLYRFTDDAFNKTYVSTIGIDFKIKTIQVDGKIIRLQIWDTAGQERFQTITKSYYRGAMGVMLLFDITNPKSFENVGKWIRDIDEHATPNVDKVLVGNKCDMESQRGVDKQTAQRLAQEYSLRYIETSSKTNVNIEESFKMLAQLILHRVGVATPLTQSRLSLNQETPKKASKCC